MLQNPCQRVDLRAFLSGSDRETPVTTGEQVKFALFRGDDADGQGQVLHGGGDTDRRGFTEQRPEDLATVVRPVGLRLPQCVRLGPRA